MAERFPRLHTIAFTQRGSISASENTWSGVLWTRDAFHVGRSYRIAPIVDRVGAGDAFAAGLIYAMLDGRAPDAALEFAVAASCLKHTIRGDVNHGQRGRGRRAGRRIRIGAGRAMTLSARLDVLLSIVETGVLPLFYSDDADRASRITDALREGGARAIEFTDRGPGAWSVFSTLTAAAARHDPDAILGAGSIRDAHAADRFIAAGARFIVGPSFNAEVARLCNGDGSHTCQVARRRPRS